MTSLVAVVADGVALEAGEALALMGAGERLLAPALAWQEGAVSVAVAGPQASLAVSPDLVVAVAGRLDDDGTGTAAPGTAAERVAAAVRRDGERFLDGLVGDLSGVVVDRRSGTLRAFRDLVGLCPLRLAHAGGRHLVATDVEVLVGPRGPVPAAASAEWLACFLEGVPPPPRLTPYDGVSLVVPGHVATPRGASWLQRRAADWSLRPVRRTDAGHAEALRAALDEAVRCRLVGVTAAAVELSGGLDSTSVLATARAVRPDLPLVALCIPFTDPAGDERALQELVAQHCGARLVWVPPDRSPYGTSPDELVRELGGPPQVPNWFLHAAVRDAALAEGVDLVMTGEDGDGVLGGGPVALAHLLTSGHLLRFAAEVLAVRRTRGLGARRVVRRSLQAAGWVGPAAGAPPPSLVPAELRDRTRSVASPRSSRPGRLWHDHVDGYLGSRYLPWLAGVLAEEWNRLPHGGSHPFLDRRVVELCLSLPVEQRQHGGWSKAVLRRAMSGRVPAAVLENPRKARISSAFEQVVREPDGQGHVTAAFRTATAMQWPWLSVDAWRRLRAMPDSPARGLLEHRAVLATAFTHAVEHGAEAVSAAAQPALLTQERG